MKNGKNVAVNQGFNTLPNVSEALLDWFQPLTFYILTKALEAYQVDEEAEEVSFRGVWQVMSPQDLQMKPEGQRDWKWFTCHSTTELELKPDDRIAYFGNQYRVKEKIDHSKYGYYEYHLVEDYE